MKTSNISANDFYCCSLFLGVCGALIGYGYFGDIQHGYLGGGIGLVSVFATLLVCALFGSD